MDLLANTDGAKLIIFAFVKYFAELANSCGFTIKSDITFIYLNMFYWLRASFTP